MSVTKAAQVKPKSVSPCPRHRAPGQDVVEGRGAEHPLRRHERNAQGLADIKGVLGVYKGCHGGVFRVYWE